MAIRIVTFTLASDMTLSPAIPQYGGVQGEHCATEVVFRLADDVLQSPAYTYYIECINASGNYDRTPALSLCDHTVATRLPLAWTQYGGIITVRLVVEETGAVLFSVEGRLQLEDRQTAMEQVDGLLRTNISEAVTLCYDAAGQAAATNADTAALLERVETLLETDVQDAVAQTRQAAEQTTAAVDDLADKLGDTDAALTAVLNIQQHLMGGVAG